MTINSISYNPSGHVILLCRYVDSFSIFLNCCDERGAISGAGGIPGFRYQVSRHSYFKSYR